MERCTVLLLLFTASFILTTTSAIEAVVTPKQKSLSTNSSFFMITMARSLILNNEHVFLVQLDNQESGVLEILSSCPVSQQTSKSGPFLVIDGFGSIPYTIPFPNFQYDNIKLEFSLFSCGDKRLDDCQKSPGHLIGRESSLIPVIKESLLLFTEISKPIYKARDNIQFRVIALYPSLLHPERFGLSEEALKELRIDSVVLESPERTRMTQWRNISWLEALRGFTYPLSADPPLGKWRIVSKMENVEDSEEFSVARYVLPRFTISLTPPPFLRAHQKNVAFSVCAKQGNGMPIKGKVQSQLCIQGKNVETKAVCIDVEAKLDGSNKCVHFVESTAPFKIQDCNYRLEQYHLFMNATVIEDGIETTLTKSAFGGELTFYPFKFVVDSPKFYKKGLPYYGIVKTLNPDSSPVPNMRVLVSYESPEAGSPFKEIFTSDSNGLVNFHIPAFLWNAKKVTILFEWADYVRTYGCLSLRKPQAIHMVKQLYSSTETYVQVYPLELLPPQKPCETGMLRIRLQSTISLHNHEISVVGTARGTLMSAQSFGPIQRSPCRDTNDPSLGHYQCAGSLNGKFMIRCRDGWTGLNCLTPICAQGCVKGFCRAPNSCVCYSGWTGEACNRCKKRPGCLNGYCKDGNDCRCFPGWTGFKCSVRNPRRRQGSRTNTVLPIERPDAMKLNDIRELRLFERVLVLKIDNRLAPTTRQVVWFRYQSGETQEFVTASFRLKNLAACLSRNKETEFKFDLDVVQPGHLVTAQIKTTGENPKCGLSLSDVTLKQFGSSGNFDVDDLESSLRRLGAKLTTREPSVSQTRKTCPKKPRPIPSYLYTTVPFKMGINVQDPRPVDSAQAFKETGILVLSNVPVVTAPCPPPRFVQTGWFHQRWYSRDQSRASIGGLEDRPRIFPLRRKPPSSNPNWTFASTQMPKMLTTAIPKKQQKEELKAVVRRFFPEVWKFSLIENEVSNMTFWTPDTITTWEAKMFCISSSGLTFAKPSKLVVFQPFYLQIVLPYSVIRGETVKIPMKLFSYLKQCTLVSLELTKSSKFEVKDRSKLSVCLCNFNQLSAFFSIKPKYLGRIAIQVKAMSHNSDKCTDKLLRKTKRSAPMIDIVERRLLVEPEGLPEETTTGDLLCPQNSSVTFPIRMDIPTGKLKVIPGSERAYLSWSGNVISAALNNLGGLIRMPYGCGEQNMMYMVPSIYVLNYLSNIPQNNSDLVTKAKKYIAIGYQRQLKYQRKDGSFSAFGQKDRRGSTWLTAFVFKSFVAARKHIEIDDFVLQRSLNFLMRKMRPNGCFREDGRIISSTLKGGLSNKKDEVTITAYILGAFVEASQDLSIVSSVNRIIRGAMRCIKRNTPAKDSDLKQLSTYAIALRSYALSRDNSLHRNLSVRYRTELWRRRVEKDSFIYWKAATRKSAATNYLRPWIKFTAADVETTGYAILSDYSLIERPRTLRTLPAIRWLLSERNGIGGWYSTQDSIVALQSLAQYATLTFGTFIGTDLKLSIRSQLTGGETEDFLINEQNRLVTTRVSIPIPSNLELTAAGVGCVAVQGKVLFNVGKIGREKTPFGISAFVTQTSRECTRSILTACARYVGEEKTSNMAIMRIRMASGWEALTEGLEGLRQQMREGALRRAEVAKDKALLLYFDYFTTKYSCAKIPLHRVVEVLDAKPIIVQIYDYYKPELVEEMSVVAASNKCLGRKRRVVSNGCPVCFKRSSKATVSILNQVCREGKRFVFTSRSNTDSNVWLYSQLVEESPIYWKDALNIPNNCPCETGDVGILVERSPRTNLNKDDIVQFSKDWTIIWVERNTLFNQVQFCKNSSAHFSFVISLLQADDADYQSIFTASEEKEVVIEPSEMTCPICGRNIKRTKLLALENAAENRSLASVIVTEKLAPTGIVTWHMHYGKGLRPIVRQVDFGLCEESQCTFERNSNGEKMFLVLAANRRKLKFNEGESKDLVIRPDGDFFISSPRRLQAMKLIEKLSSKEKHDPNCFQCLEYTQKYLFEMAKLVHMLKEGRGCAFRVTSSKRKRGGFLWKMTDIFSHYVHVTKISLGNCSISDCIGASSQKERNFVVVYKQPREQFLELVRTKRKLKVNNNFVMARKIYL